MNVPVFFHLYIIPNPTVTERVIHTRLDAAIDWFQYHPTAYVLYATQDASWWYHRLDELVKPEGSLFVCQLDLRNRQGWMDKSFWQWIEEKEAGAG
jgi:hypothetical protein